MAAVKFVAAKIKVIGLANKLKGHTYGMAWARRSVFEEGFTLKLSLNKFL